MASTRTEKLALALVLVLGCNGDDAGPPAATETTGDGDSGDGDGDSGDGDGESGDGDGDGDSGDGDGDGEGGPTCAWAWEAPQMKNNGQTHAALDVDVAPNGEFVAVGRLENSTNDAWIGRFSPDGEPLWEQVVDNDGSDYAAAVTFDQAGDIVVLGSSGMAMWVHKRSADGSAAWTVDVVSQFEGDNTPGDIALAPDGSLVVTGAIRAGVQDTDVWVRKLSTDGSETWTTTWSGQADQSGYSIDRGGSVSVAADGTIYVGASEGVNFETREGVLFAFGPDGGSELWTLSPRVDGMPHLHDGGPVEAGPEGEVYFVVSTAAMASAFWLYRVAPSGDIDWELAEADFIYGSTSSWTVAGLDARGEQLTIGGTFLEEEPGQAIFWSNVWVADVDFSGQGSCIDSHTWQNVHIIPASTHAYGLRNGPNGTVTVGEIIDGPENYLWVGGFE